MSCATIPGLRFSKIQRYFSVGSNSGTSEWGCPLYRIRSAACFLQLSVQSYFALCSCSNKSYPQPPNLAGSGAHPRSLRCRAASPDGRQGEGSQEDGKARSQEHRAEEAGAAGTHLFSFLIATCNGDDFLFVELSRSFAGIPDELPSLAVPEGRVLCRKKPCSLGKSWQLNKSKSLVVLQCVLSGRKLGWCPSTVHLPLNWLHG